MSVDVVLGLRLSDFRPTGVELANRVRPFSVAVERSDCSGGLSDSDIDNTTPPACLPVAPRAQGIASFRLGVLAVLIVLAPWSSLEAAPIEVRFAEGAAHGLLLVRSVSGETVGHGDLLQTAHGDRVESRLILRFKDGSLHDEHVVFSQQGVFTLLSYRLMQRGPSFPDTVEVSLDRKTGSYKARSARDGKEQESSGSFELPPDVYGGEAPEKSRPRCERDRPGRGVHTEAQAYRARDDSRRRSASSGRRPRGQATRFTL